MRTVLPMLFPLALLAACATSSPLAPPPAANAEQATRADACGASGFRHLIGTPADQIDRGIITPDTMVTQDFSPERLNIMVGTDGQVGSLSCF